METDDKLKPEYQTTGSVADCRRKGWVLLGFIFASLLIVTWMFIHWNLDVRLTQRFYSTETGWYLRYQQPWEFIYKYGTVPGLLFTLAALVAWTICVLKPRFQHLQRYFLVIVLTAVLGPGLIVNGVLKNYWGRPRPRQTQEFGGQWEYRHINQPGVPGKGKSFPGGHATMGFIFVTLFYFRRQSPVLAYAGGAAGLVFGTIIGITRTVQGAHFPSDSVWSLGVILMVSTALYYLVLQVPKPHQPSARRLSPLKKRLAVGLVSVAIVLITGGFLLHRPFFKTYRFDLPVDPSTRRLIVSSSDPFANVELSYRRAANPQARIDARGFAWTRAKLRLEKIIRSQDSQVKLALNFNRKGYFAELSNELFVELPEDAKGRVTLEVIEAKD